MAGPSTSQRYVSFSLCPWIAGSVDPNQDHPIQLEISGFRLEPPGTVGKLSVFWWWMVLFCMSVLWLGSLVVRGFVSLFVLFPGQSVVCHLLHVGVFVGALPLYLYLLSFSFI